QLKGIPEKVRVYKVRRETPLGVGQVPVKPAPAPASGFAPGEKARLVAPAGAAPAAPAPVPVPAGVLPSTWKRLAALAIDGIVCSVILSMFSGGHSAKVRVTKKLAAPPAAVTTDANGATVSAGDAKLRFDDKGVRGRAGDVKINIDESGVHVEKDGKAAKGPVPVYDDKKGTTVSVEGSDDEEDDRGGSRFWKHSGFALVWFVYSLVFLKMRSATPGKLLMKLKVVSMDGAALNKHQRLMRAAVSVFSGYALFLGYFWALWEPQKRGWHDLVAGTRVVPAE
ncbi:MAG: RDD family protein, partial [Elusimicrobia bacterium]|nr:RDD family protein [Elusimicrobiota bacterium]